MTDPQAQRRLMRAATTAAVAVAVILIVAKTWVYIDLKAVSLLSTLADSVTDLLASGLNFLAVRFALSPPDAQHRFGHGKAEPLSALAQAALVAGAGALVGVEAVTRFYNPAPLTDGTAGIAVTAFSMVLTTGLVAFQRYVISRTDSLAIGADALHYGGDLLLNGSVIAALVLSTSFGLTWADPVFGAAISAFILFNAGRIFVAALNALLDRELPDSERARILALARVRPEVKDIHALRTRASGVQKFIQMHIVLDKNLKLSEAHRISDAVQQEIEKAFPGADIIIHADPEGADEVLSPLDRAVAG